MPSDFDAYWGKVQSEIDGDPIRSTYMRAMIDARRRVGAIEAAHLQTIQNTMYTTRNYVVREIRRYTHISAADSEKLAMRVQDLLDAGQTQIVEAIDEGRSVTYGDLLDLYRKQTAEVAKEFGLGQVRVPPPHLIGMYRQMGSEPWKTALTRVGGSWGDSTAAVVAKGIATGWSVDKLADTIATFAALPDVGIGGQLDLKSRKAMQDRVQQMRITSPNMLGATEEMQKAWRSMRNNARRIAVSEIHNARAEAEVLAWAMDPLVKAVRWNLSPNRGSAFKPPDECDVLAHSDFYGLGSGVYPVEAVPFPPHPYDRCSRTPILRKPQHANKPKPGGGPFDAAKARIPKKYFQLGALTPAKEKRIIGQAQRAAGMGDLARLATDPDPDLSPGLSRHFGRMQTGFGVLNRATGVFGSDKPPTAAATFYLAEKIGGQGGSNPGGMFQGEDGVARYVKKYDAVEQAVEEAAANALYRLMGVPAPTSQLVWGSLPGRDAGLLHMAPIIEHEMTLGGFFQKHGPGKEWSEAARDIIGGGFVADVLLRNWDVAGTGFDNMVLSTDEQGNPVWVRIDAGGAISFRAQGERKQDPYDENWTSEFVRMAQSSWYGRLFQAAGYELGDAATAGHKEKVAKIWPMVDADAQLDRIQAAIQTYWDSLDGETQRKLSSAGDRNITLRMVLDQYLAEQVETEIEGMSGAKKVLARRSIQKTSRMVATRLHYMLTRREDHAQKEWWDSVADEKQKLVLDSIPLYLTELRRLMNEDGLDRAMAERAIRRAVEQEGGVLDLLVADMPDRWDLLPKLESQPTTGPGSIKPEFQPPWDKIRQIDYSLDKHGTFWKDKIGAEAAVKHRDGFWKGRGFPGLTFTGTGGYKEFNWEQNGDTYKVFAKTGQVWKNGEEVDDETSADILRSLAPAVKDYYESLIDITDVLGAINQNAKGHTRDWRKDMLDASKRLSQMVWDRAEVQPVIKDIRKAIGKVYTDADGNLRDFDRTALQELVTTIFSAGDYLKNKMREEEEAGRIEGVHRYGTTDSKIVIQNYEYLAAKFEQLLKAYDKLVAGEGKYTDFSFVYNEVMLRATDIRVMDPLLYAYLSGEEVSTQDSDRGDGLPQIDKDAPGVDAFSKKDPDDDRFNFRIKESGFKTLMDVLREEWSPPLATLGEIEDLVWQMRLSMENENPAVNNWTRARINNAKEMRALGQKQWKTQAADVITGLKNKYEKILKEWTDFNLTDAEGNPIFTDSLAVGGLHDVLQQIGFLQRDGFVTEEEVLKIEQHIRAELEDARLMHGRAIVSALIEAGVDRQMLNTARGQELNQILDALFPTDVKGGERNFTKLAGLGNAVSDAIQVVEGAQLERVTPPAAQDVTLEQDGKTYEASFVPSTTIDTMLKKLEFWEGIADPDPDDGFGNLTKSDLLDLDQVEGIVKEQYDQAIAQTYAAKVRVGEITIQEARDIIGGLKDAGTFFQSPDSVEYATSNLEEAWLDWHGQRHIKYVVSPDALVYDDSTVAGDEAIKKAQQERDWKLDRTAVMAPATASTFLEVVQSGKWTQEVWIPRDKIYDPTMADGKEVKAVRHEVKRRIAALIKLRGGDSAVEDVPPPDDVDGLMALLGAAVEPSDQTHGWTKEEEFAITLDVVRERGYAVFTMNGDKPNARAIPLVDINRYETAPDIADAELKSFYDHGGPLDPSDDFAREQLGAARLRASLEDIERSYLRKPFEKFMSGQTDLFGAKEKVLGKTLENQPSVKAVAEALKKAYPALARVERHAGTPVAKPLHESLAEQLSVMSSTISQVPTGKLAAALADNLDRIGRLLSQARSGDVTTLAAEMLTQTAEMWDGTIAVELNKAEDFQNVLALQADDWKRLETLSVTWPESTVHFWTERLKEAHETQREKALKVLAAKGALWASPFGPRRQSAAQAMQDEPTLSEVLDRATEKWHKTRGAGGFTSHSDLTDYMELVKDAAEALSEDRYEYESMVRGAIEHWTGGPWKETNRWLRGRTDAEPGENTKKLYRRLDALHTKIPRWTGSSLWRGDGYSSGSTRWRERADTLKKAYETGEPYTTRGVFATSTHQDAAEAWASGNGEDVIIINVRGPDGRDSPGGIPVEEFGGVGGEYEVIQPRDRMWRVVEYAEDVSGYRRRVDATIELIEAGEDEDYFAP